MSQDYTKVVETMLNDTDGKSAFVRFNKAMLNQTACIYPLAMSNLSLVLFSKCLVNVPRQSSDNGETEVDPPFDEFNKGRWSYPFTTEELLMDTTPSQRMKGKASSTNKIIRTLLKRKAFYRFTVDGGVESASIYTYNRYPFLNGVFWPQHAEAEDFYDNEFSPPTTPITIAALTSQNSYRNAVSRLSRTMHNKMRGRPRWSTLQQTKDNIKEAFCSKFIKELVEGACPSVKQKFVDFKDSGLSADEYVEYVWKTAVSLPAYEGVDMSVKFLRSLHLPVNYIRGIISIIETSSDPANIPDIDGSVQVHCETSAETLSSTPKGDAIVETTKYSTEAGRKDNQILYGQVVEYSEYSGFEQENGGKPMDINELQKQKVFTNRIREIRIKEEEEGESLPSGLRREKDRQVDCLDSHCEISSDQDLSTYNADMKSKDKSLSDQQVQDLSFSIVDFIPKASKVRIQENRKDKTEDEKEREVLVQMAKEGRKLERRLQKKSVATILNSANKFVAEFRKILKELNPSVRFVINQEQELNDRRASQAAVDKLRIREALDEDILREWMKFTIRLNLKSRIYVGVQSMLSCYSKFEPCIPSAEAIQKIKNIRTAVAPKRKNVVANSMDKLFAEGWLPNRVSMSCQLWGIPLTAQYLSSNTNASEARRMIVEAIRQSTNPEVNGAFSTSLKFGDLMNGLLMAEWREIFAEDIKRVGRLDSFVLSDYDRENVAEFLDKFGGKA